VHDVVEEAQRAAGFGLHDPDLVLRLAREPACAQQ